MSNFRRRLAELSSEEEEHLLGELPRLLLEGHRIQTLCRLLSDYAFIEAKINHPDFGVKALIEDYDLIDDVEFREYYYQIVKSFKDGYPTITTLKLIQSALRLSTHILLKDKTQLPGQLSGRLLYFDAPEIQQFLQQIPQTQTIYLRSLRASLSSPNGRLLSTLSGHIGSVNAVAVTPDGQLLISGSSDNIVKVWDLNTGTEVLTFTGHSSPVIAIAVTPDGKRVISGASDNTVRVWNLATGTEILTFNGHSLPVVALAVTPDGKKAVSASIAKKNSIKVWDLATGKEELTLEGHGDIVRTVAITSCNSVISASDNGTIKVWNLTNGKILFSLTHGYDGYTYLGHGVNIPDRKLEAVYAIGVTRDGKWLISGSGNHGTNIIIIWNLETIKEAFTLKGHKSLISALAVTPDGKQVISASFDNTIKIWDLESGKEILSFIGHDDSIYDLTITLDGNKIISASKDKTIKVWNLESIIKDWNLDPKKKHIQLTEKKESVNDLTITPDGRQVFFGLQDNTIKVSNLEEDNLSDSFPSNYKVQDTILIRIIIKKIFETYIRSIEQEYIKFISKSPLLFSYLSSLLLALIFKDYMLGLGVFIIFFSILFVIKHCFNLLFSASNSLFKKQYFKQKIGLSQHSKYSDIKIELSQDFERKGIISVAIAPNNWLICIDNQIASPFHFLSVWNYTEKKKIFDLLSISQYCYLYLSLLIYVIDISIFIFLSLHGSWRIFLLITLYVVHKALYSLITFMFYESVTTISITPDGKYLISGSTNKTLKIWNLQTKKLSCVLKGHGKEVTSVTITPDGKYLISGSKDKTIKIWNLKTKKQLFTLTGHKDSVNTISITPDGKYLISGSKDKTIKIWNLETREEIFTFTGHTESINAIKVTSNGQLVISASSDKTIQVWNFITRKIIAKFTGESAIKCCAVAPDDVTIVAGDISGSVHFLRFEGINL